ncbi:Conserved_hypothetical protein [Hexamita inflata]|uniref:Uncharacterized protein n=1 Tax=Hexamita inflata TaxID=28002 RepID=A0AA86NYB5_9EUKA|nr:Conserved hypothetical protein [Hexamita inflata]
MNAAKDQQFSNAIQQYIWDEHQTRFQQLNHCYHFLCTLNSKQRYGMWKKVGAYSQMDSKSCREYFHNTWSSKFYEPVSSYRDEIKRLASQLQDQQEVISEFIKRHPEKNFGKHELRVVVNTICKRVSNGSISNQNNSSEEHNSVVIFDFVDIFQ